MRQRCSKPSTPLTDAVTARWDRLALAVLQAGDPAEKSAAAKIALEELVAVAGPLPVPVAAAPDRPARPAKPMLVPPGQTPRRRLGSVSGRVALLHAVAHIEFNAIDLAFDMALRFAGEIDAAGLDDAAFVWDWFTVGADEARHFGMINTRLGELGAAYGDCQAHDGLWKAAESTADSVLARLAIAPLVLEARGLDVTPGMIAKLDAAGDRRSADLLRIILSEEVGHVRKGRVWFEAVCRARSLDSLTQFRTLVEARFAGGLKPPFNQAAPQNAGLDRGYYEAT